MSPRFAVSFLFVAVAPIAAQEQARDTARMTPVVVSATRTPLSQSTLPVAVTVITGDELRARGVTTVSDALNDVTSAYVTQSGSQGGVTGLHLRGGESKYVKVLVDGVPANDPGGAYDFGSLTTDNVDRIEIVRGPASVIHGADAVTGVVHVLTRRGHGPPRVEAELRTGSAPRERLAASDPMPDAMQTWDFLGALTGETASGSYSFSLARHQSTGLYALNNHFQNNVLSGRFRVTPAAGTELRASLRYNDYQFNYPTRGGGDVGDSNAYRAEDRSIVGIEIERRVTSTLATTLALSSSLNDGGTHDALDAAGGNSFISQDKTRRRGAELRVHFAPGSRGSFALGAQIEQQDQRNQSQSQSAFGPSNSLFRAARRNTGVYAELLLTPTPRLGATFGARIDDNERFGSFGTGRIGASWWATTSTRVRATAGNAFREPSFFENYATGFVTGNPTLRPERTASADVGIEQQLASGRALVSVTGFAQRFRDMIDYTGDNTACGYSYCNVAEARANGVEIEIATRLAGPLQATVGGTLLRTRVVLPGYDSTVFGSGLYRRDQPLIRRPDQKWTAQLSYRGASPLSASVRWIAVGERPDRDFRPFPNMPVTLAAYQRLDVGAEYALRLASMNASALTLRVENLLNAGYQNIFNFLAPRRTVLLGARASL